MKYYFILIFICLSLVGKAQSKTEFGVTAEGSWFMPYQDQPLGHDWATRPGFGTGLGVYASRDIFWRFSADIGLMFRYKQMQQHYSVIKSSGGNNQIYDGWYKLSIHHIVVPIHLQLLAGKYFFIRGGIESTWVTNYSYVSKKPEFNWTMGFGSQKFKLKWSVNFIKGFKYQGFGNKTMEPNGYYKFSINRNYMFQLSLSYPINFRK